MDDKSFGALRSTMRLLRWCSLALIASAVLVKHAAAQDESRQFTFSWQFWPSDEMRPRGGTSKGASVDLALAPTAEWQRLREPGLSKFERDRRAILAMAGGYRTSFDFIETVGFTSDFEPARPYQSWGTEFIYVVADSGELISLQHIMVMFVEDDAGTVHGPIVQKHWRQDWRYQDTSVHEYVGNDTWRQRHYPDAAVAGLWSQAVYQVDDSPRYEAIGAWVHDSNYSAWTSGTTWRPLPRRESSIRDDYQVLIGTNRHTIVPSGWVQEEENLKAVVDRHGKVSESGGYLSRELGVNRYERIVNFDFSAGDRYWQSTGQFWADVRSAWRQVYDDHDEFVFVEHDGERALWQAMFEYAGALEEGASYDAQDSRRFAAETIRQYLR